MWWASPWCPLASLFPCLPSGPRTTAYSILREVTNFTENMILEVSGHTAGWSACSSEDEIYGGKSRTGLHQEHSPCSRNHRPDHPQPPPANTHHQTPQTQSRPSVSPVLCFAKPRAICLHIATRASYRRVGFCFARHQHTGPLWRPPPPEIGCPLRWRRSSTATSKVQD